MGYRLDDIDRRILYELMANARDTSAPAIADKVNVSPGTIRNRIDQLEANGIITGYRAEINFERADGRLTNLYLCTVPVAERETLAQEARGVPGVINVRELMTGRQNLHVLAVGEDTEDLRRVSRALSKLGIEIEDEDLVESETTVPYAQFGPEEARSQYEPTDFISLTGDANVVDVTVQEGATIVGQTLAEAMDTGILNEETLVIAIERGGRVMTPHGNTTIQSDDIVTLLSRGGNTDDTLAAFVDRQTMAE